MYPKNEVYTLRGYVWTGGGGYLQLVRHWGDLHLPFCRFLTANVEVEDFFEANRVAIQENATLLISQEAALPPGQGYHSE